MASRSPFLALLVGMLALGCASEGATEEPPEPGGSVLPPGIGVVPEELTCDEPVPAFRGHVAACSLETRSCVDDCAGDGPCVQSCLAEDTSLPSIAPSGLVLDCELCVSWQTAVCVEEAGCQAEAADLACCRSQRCTGRDDLSDCSASECATERSRYGACVSRQALHCITASTEGAFASCFAPAE